jgi:hypothetical protein
MVKPTRVSDRGGRYVPSPISHGLFSSEQLRFLQEEFQSISTGVNANEEGWYPQWDDLRFPFTQTRRGALGKPDFDYTDIGLLFPQNDVTEIIYLIAQIPHGYRPGSDIRPHIHWRQTGAALPTWVMEYKWFNTGDAIPASFTTISASTAVITYTSGSIHQLTSFGDIDGSGKSLSSILLIKLYRNDNIVTGDVLAYEFDIHYQSIAAGSRNEFSDV